MKETKFTKIYKNLEAQIVMGHYEVDSPFPSLSTLMKQYSASRPTICKVMQALEDNFLIHTKNGVGSIVANPEKIAQEQHVNIEIGVGFASGYIIPTYNYMLALLKGIRLASETYNFSIRILDNSDLKIWKKLNHRPNGLILSPFSKLDLNQALYEITSRTNTPIALINRSVRNSNISEFYVDYRKESCAAISKFLKDGYKRIAVYYNTDDSDFLSLRIQGWRDAYIENDMEIPEDLIILSKDNDEYTQKLDALLARETPEMFFCINGSCFHKTQMELLKRNIVTPRDTKLLCFDDIGEFIQEFSIDASYIKMPLEEMGFLAAENLYKRLIASPSTSVIKKCLNAKLIS